MVLKFMLITAGSINHPREIGEQDQGNYKRGCKKPDKAIHLVR